MTYQNKPRVLARTATTLAVLTAEHALRRNGNHIWPDMPDIFEKRLRGKINIPSDVGNIRIQHGLRHWLVEQLFDAGKVPATYIIRRIT